MGADKKQIGESGKGRFNNEDKLKVKGLERGIEQTEIRHIYEMKKEGIPIEVIARVIGKSIEEIQSMDLQDK